MRVDGPKKNELETNEFTAFVFLLTLTLGYCHPSRLIDELTASELHDWWAYFQAEPWGPTRDDGRVQYQIALLGSMLSGDALDSAVALPRPVGEVYGPAEMSDELVERLQAIRDKQRERHGNRIDDRD